MGAGTFFTESRGKTAKEAFDKAVDKARYDHGHAGYTGTIAEKDKFVMIDLPKGEDPQKFAEKLIDTSDARIDSKWGPAGCIETDKGRYLFFGWASS